MLLCGMFLATFMAGYWPGIISDTRTVNLIGILGGGYLMGAALVIVLPEAIHTLIESTDAGVFEEQMVF